MSLTLARVNDGRGYFPTLQRRRRCYQHNLFRPTRRQRAVSLPRKPAAAATQRLRLRLCVLAVAKATPSRQAAMAALPPGWFPPMPMHSSCVQGFCLRPSL